MRNIDLLLTIGRICQKGECRNGCPFDFVNDKTRQGCAIDFLYDKKIARKVLKISHEIAREQ